MFFLDGMANPLDVPVPNITCRDIQSSFYVGKLIILAPGDLIISNIPFPPKSITFKALASVSAFNSEPNGNIAKESRGIQNFTGTMHGYAKTGAYNKIDHQVISSGHHSLAPSLLTQFASDKHCIAFRYTNPDGKTLGVIKAKVKEFTSDGFILSIEFEKGEVYNDDIYPNVLPMDIMNQGLVVLFEAHQ